MAWAGSVQVEPGAYHVSIGLLIIHVLEVRLDLTWPTAVDIWSFGAMASDCSSQMRHVD